MCDLFQMLPISEGLISNGMTFQRYTARTIVSPLCIIKNVEWKWVLSMKPCCYCSVEDIMSLVWETQLCLRDPPWRPASAQDAGDLLRPKTLETCLGPRRWSPDSLQTRFQSHLEIQPILFTIRKKFIILKTRVWFAWGNSFCTITYIWFLLPFLMGPYCIDP